jgi:hypothetical protein
MRPRYFVFTFYILVSFLMGALVIFRTASAQETQVSVDSEETLGQAKRTDALRPVVAIELAGADRDIEVTQKVMAELLTGLPVTTTWTRSKRVDHGYVLGYLPDEKDVLARFWVELNGPDIARIYVSEGASGTLLVRTIQMPNGVDAVVTESIGQLAGSVVEALLAGGTLGVQRRDAGILSSNARSSQLQTPSSISSSRPLAFGVALGYQLQGYSSKQVLAHYLTTSFFIARSFLDWEPMGWLTLQYRFQSVLEPDPIGTRLEAAGGRLFGGLVLPGSGAFRWRAGAGGGVDAMRIEPLVKNWTTTLAARDRWSAVPVLAAALQFQLGVGSTVALFAAAGIDLPLVHVHFYEQHPAGRHDLLVPWPVQPWISLGATFDVVPQNN